MNYFYELVKNPLFSLITIIIGVVISHLITFIAKLFKTKFIIWYNTLITKSVTNQGLIGEYKNIEVAFEKICNEISKSRNVSICVGLGTKIRDVFHTIRPNINITIYLPDDNPAGGINWLAERANEIKKNSSLSYYNDIQEAVNEINLIRSTIKTFEMSNNGSTYVKRYNSPHIYRIILTDSVVFFSPYVRDKYIDSTPISCYIKGSYMYDHLSKVMENMHIQSYNEVFALPIV